MQTREKTETLERIKEYQTHPITLDLKDLAERNAKYYDTEFRAGIRVQGNPYATAENHAWADGAKWAFNEVAELLQDADYFLDEVEGDEDE